MGANLLILVSSLLVQTPTDTTSPPASETSSGHGIGYERLEDALRYDRVQGVSLGLGYRARLPLAGATTLYGTVRYGVSDDRITGRLTILRDGPGVRLAASGYRDIASVAPFAPGGGFGNTLNALFVAHDNADYVLAYGGSIGAEVPLAAGLDLDLGARLERQASVTGQASSDVNDFLGGEGLFPPNPPVDRGTFGGGWLRLTGYGGTRWSVTADVLGGGPGTTGRVYGEVRQGFGGRRGLTVRVKGGAATRPTLDQFLFRAGGPYTVRGFDYGVRRGPAFWAAQADLAPLRGRLRPVLFLDAGQAGSGEDLFSDRVLVGGGLGLSVFSGLVRFDLSHPIAPDSGGKIRFDIVVQAVR